MNGANGSISLWSTDCKTQCDESLRGICIPPVDDDLCNANVMVERDS